MMLLSSALPHEVARLLPADPNEQLELAHRISLNAFNQKVSGLEAEVSELRDLLAKKTNLANTLEARLNACKSDLYKAEERVKEQVEVHRKLSLENAELGTTIRKLRRSLTRVETFKKNLLHSLQADEAENTDDGHDDRLSYGAAVPSFERLRASSHAQLHKPTMPSGDEAQHDLYGSSHMQGDMRTEELHASTQSMPKLNNNKEIPHLEGKELFRMARSRLSAESFADFVSTIKLLNNGQQSREKTLEAAKSIFGSAHDDLYGSFENLITRHMTQNTM